MTGALDNDVIVAAATPPGQGGIGVVRLSGAGAKAIGQAICSKALRVRTAVYCDFCFANEVIDQGIGLYFAGPHSFTGEDVVELQGHGSPVVMQRLLDAAVALGARLARAGEFSERAFAHGRIDLAQAEAVADLIASGSVEAARAAMRSLQGHFSALVHEITTEVEQLRIYIEAAIDFPDEELELLTDDGVTQRLAQLHQTLDQLLQDSRQGKQLNQGLQMVILGAPNAGKSSLLNALAQDREAIVSDLPGTTRDLLKIDLLFDGVPVRLVDTAGLRADAQDIEKIGIERAREIAGQADLLLLVCDSSELSAHQFAEHLDQLLVRAQLASPLPPTLVIANKRDLVAEPELPQLPWPVVPVSAKLRQGLDQLRQSALQAIGHSGEHAPFTARLRHLDALQRGLHSLQQVQRQIAQSVPAELVAEELRQMHLCLGEIVGEVSSDELLGKIFSQFCIGK